MLHDHPHYLAFGRERLSQAGALARGMGISLVFVAALYIFVTQGAGGVNITLVNKCQFPIWPAGTQVPGLQLDIGKSSTVQLPENSTTGRFWGRTGCSFGTKCITGDCGNTLDCQGEGIIPPATLAEYSLNAGSNDYYDISLVDGFNLPMSIIPSNSRCNAIVCSSDINSKCPAELRAPDACRSACVAFNTSQYCCLGNYSGQNNCLSTNYSRFFKTQCPHAYSYSYDDASSLFTCPGGTDYKIVFCDVAATSSPSPAPASVTDRSAKVSGFVLPITISGALLIALALTAAGFAVYWKKFRSKQRLNEDCLPIMVPNSTKSRAFTLGEIMEATQNLNQKIGQGGFGSVFFGKLRDGRQIAVKMLSLFSIEGLHQFQNEVDLLSNIHHKNLVSLLGYCNESKEVMLIYEYMSPGSLRDNLYGPRAEISQLNWKTRLKIALDAAQGLEYLHVGCIPKIIHRDIKTANILLDSNMNGKLADFGLSRITADGEASYANTAVKGTIGYLDPEYFRTQMLTEKSDVYSFGVVLLEIICGRPPINANLREEELNLVQWATPYVKMDENAGDIEVIIDKRLDGNYDIRSVVEVAKLAFRCLEGRPSSRPSVSEVVTQIKEAIVRENGNSTLPVSEGIGIEHRDVQVNNFHSIPRKMEWADNSSNLSQVGR